jgi:hypothetical protein
VKETDMPYVLTNVDPTGAEPARVETGDLAWLSRVIGNIRSYDDEPWDSIYALITTERDASRTGSPLGTLREVEIQYLADRFRVRAGMNILASSEYA